MKKKHGGEGKHPDVALGEGLEIGSVHSAHKKGLVHGLGNHQGANDAPMAESNVETLRHGKAPKPGKVNNMAPMNMGVQKKAHGFNERSQNGGAEKDGGW